MTDTIDTKDVVLTVDNDENIAKNSATKTDGAKTAKRKEKDLNEIEKAKKIHDKNVQLSQENARIKSELSSATRKSDSLRRELEASQKQIEKLQEVNKMSVLRIAEERKLRAQYELQGEEQKALLMEREKKTLELQEKFESSIKDIQEKIESHSKAEAAANESSMLKEKIEKVMEDVNSRHEEINKMIKAKDAEIEAANKRSDKLAQISLQLEANNKELLEKLTLTTKHRDALQSTIDQYSEKFQSLQKVIDSTSETFGEYKKQNNMLKKENELLNLKLQKNGGETLTLYDKFKKLSAELESEKAKRAKLAELCQVLRKGDVGAAEVKNAAEEAKPEATEGAKEE